MSGKWLNRIAGVLALAIGAMAIVAGGQVLLGKDPGYHVIDWVPVYNVGMGVVSALAASVLLWSGHRWALAISAGTLTLHGLVMAILLAGYNGVVASESIRAMTIRIVVWSVIAGLALVAMRRQVAGVQAG